MVHIIALIPTLTLHNIKLVIERLTNEGGYYMGCAITHPYNIILSLPKDLCCYQWSVVAIAMWCSCPLAQQHGQHFVRERSIA